MDVDILIVGGGLTGASLMIALNRLGYSTRLVEAKPFSSSTPSHFDVRSLALAPASVRILKTLEIWPLLANAATPIQKIHISEKGQFGKAVLHASQTERPLGFVVEMDAINAALAQAINPEHVIAPATVNHIAAKTGLVTLTANKQNYTLQAKLVVAADGTDSTIRQLLEIPAKTYPYEQHALVANIGLARDHQGIAYERFTQSGPLALLPMSQSRVAMVWSLTPAEARQLHTCDDSLFLKELQRTFGYRLGAFTQVGQRVIYPLRQVIMTKQIIGKTVFVGNAVHTLHPVAGQGFNLGLRDIAALAQCIHQHGVNEQMLNTYQSWRTHDQQVMSQSTHGLVKLFTHSLPGLAPLRGLGLLMLDNTPLLQQCIQRYASGFGGFLSDLVCGIPFNAGEPA